ncbi:hypothetical protein [Thalassotalea agariperforans]
MNKSQITRVELEDALKRILSEKTERIDPNRKLSIKAVEEEAGLGDGSAYYYKDVVAKIKEAVIQNSPKVRKQNIYENKIAELRERLANEKRLKEKYYKQVEEYKDKLSEMASQHNQLALMIQQYQYQVAELAHNIVPLKPPKM